MNGIGVALSGGGHRASLFGLGVLLYLGDAGKRPEVTSLASVSGGSLTNGFVAQTVDLTRADDGGTFERAKAKRAITEVRDLARGIHPAVLTDRGLDAALSALATRMRTWSSSARGAGPSASRRSCSRRSSSSGRV